jgi:acetyl esterase/lipase
VPRLRGDPVLLAFHGGGYICGSAAENDATSLIYRNVVQYTPIKHVLSVDYRLANKAPWPLPLLDAIAAYYHLVAVEGIDERDILIGGDSAGGHLALATMRWIRDAGPQLGLRGPRAALLFSPWCDIGFTHVWGDKLMKHNLGTDIIHDSFGPFASGLLTRAMKPGCIHEDVYLSPASRLIAPNAGMFAGFPPMFITYGEVERISLEITDVFRRIQLSRRSQPAVIPDELYQAPDAVHDFMIFPWFADETAAALERLDDWLRDLLSRDDTEDDDLAVSMSLGPHHDLQPLAMISPATELPPPLAPLTSARPGPGPQASSRPSPHLSPFSPFSPLSPLQSPYFHALSPEERQRRQEKRAALASAKSPRMVPVRDTPRLMYADMRHEGLHYLDIPHLDLGGSGGSGVPIGTAALEEDELRLDAHQKDHNGSDTSSGSDSTSRPPSRRAKTSPAPPRSKM